jgi:hypothetical protein
MKEYAFALEVNGVNLGKICLLWELNVFVNMNKFKPSKYNTVGL